MNRDLPTNLYKNFFFFCFNMIKEKLSLTVSDLLSTLREEVA